MNIEIKNSKFNIGDKVRVTGGHVGTVVAKYAEAIMRVDEDGSVHVEAWWRYAISPRNHDVMDHSEQYMSVVDEVQS